MGFIGCLCGCACFLSVITVVLLLLSQFLSMVLNFWQKFPGLPENIKDIQPQLFESHPPRNLKGFAHQLKSSQYEHLTSKLVGKCEDFELAENGDIYCVNTDSVIIRIDGQTHEIENLFSIGKGTSYGNKLSLDHTKLYFINSQLGLCEYNIIQNISRPLVSEYNGKKLQSLNSIETNPDDSNILYITQSTTELPMHLHTVDILLNNPFGRLFELDIDDQQLTLITEGLYFPNGIVYQLYNGNQPTLLVAETNRFRVIRVYLSWFKKGQKEVAIDQLDLFIDNMKLTKQGHLWIAGPSIRDELSHLADRMPIIRTIITRLPTQILPHLTNTKYFGGIKVTFNEKTKTQYDIKYYLYHKLEEFAFVTTIMQWKNKLIMSSLMYDGLFIVDLDKVGENISGDRTEEL